MDDFEFIEEYIKIASAIDMPNAEIAQNIQAPELNPKEQRVVNRLQNVPGLVIAHGLGTGKTRTSIQVANQMQQPTNVVVPASLQDNYKKELNKWVGGQPDYMNVQSQQRVGRNGLHQGNNKGLLIVDEAHRARDTQSSLLNALKQSQAKKRLLLTATPVYNHPADLAPLVNLAANDQVLPESRAGFSEAFIDEKQVEPGILASLMGIKPGTEQVLKHDPRLVDAIRKYVDYDPGRGAEGFPASKEEVVTVPMSDAQQNLYDTMMDKAPFWVKWKVKAGLPPNRTELQSLQAFLTGPRQIANSNYDFIKNKAKVESPKVVAAVNYLRNELAKNPNYKAVVYSNYLGSGLAPYKMQLDKHQIPYGEFSGDVTAKLRNQMVRDYNENKLKALLISSAGAEGLDLKGTRLLQILEPHFNREKEKQIIGRAIRYQSHAALPENERNVLVQRYLAQPKANWFDRLLGKETVKGTDEYISGIADRKELLNKQLIQLIAEQQKRYATRVQI
jgi:SNF2 family DNA or RNA helicase